jgi:hypothetical protein
MVNLLADMAMQPANLQPDLRPAEPSADKTGPLAKILTPSPETVVAGLLTVTGTATDRDGVVAGVEVSVDGGATWHPAAGTDSWRYEWQVPATLDQATIVSRATDDSSNLGEVSPGVRVRSARSRTQ